MIMTQTKEASTTFESKPPTEQMNGHSMTSIERQDREESGSSSNSPLSEGPVPGEDTSGQSVLAMGSTDSASNAHGGGPSCGLVSSLFSSSCRGRAEAFARRLHRRLTSLGGEGLASKREQDGLTLGETSWLHPTTATGKSIASTAGNHVLKCQPRHSPESDLYYDFDIDLEDGPGSPAEEATAAELADLLVNPKILKGNHRNGCHCSPNGIETLNNLEQGSDYLSASPNAGTSPDSDSSEAYFDPESSDLERPKTAFFDPPSKSSSNEPLSTLSNGDGSINGPVNGIALTHRRVDSNSDICDSFDSNSSSKKIACAKKRCLEKRMGSSEESLNGKSSLETTSPSHESLWSTFDESTISLQDESPSSTLCEVDDVQPCLPKSHSDSEIPLNGERIISDTYELRKAAGMKDEMVVDEVDFVRGDLENATIGEDLKYVKEEFDFKEKSASVENNEKPEETTEQKILTYPPSIRVDECGSSDTDTDHSTYSSTINIPGALTLECSTGVRVTESVLKNEVNLQIGNEDEKMCELLKRLGTDDSSSDKQNGQNNVEEEEEEEEEERPRRIRRSSSLKTGKTPPGTPGRKKIVRFADVLGLDLADVRTFLDEIPRIPNSAYSDLIYDDIFQKESSPINASVSWSSRYAERRGSGATMPAKLSDRTLLPLFQQPGGLSTFLDIVRERRVCLENVVVTDPVALCIQGTVRVINLDFHKSVHIRYTLNSWKNFSDLQATYVPNSCDGFSDKFSFVLYCHTLRVGQRLEFAVRFHCKGQQYWDNNSGVNYCFQCLPATSQAGYIPITAHDGQPGEWANMFY